MKKRIWTGQQGFTLVEVIAVLVLVGIMATVAGFGLVTGVRGYLLAAENTALTQKAQTTMSRITREVLECFDCHGGSETITLPFSYENTQGDREINLASGTLLVGPAGNPHSLVDQVESLSLDRGTDGRIGITLTIQHRQGGGSQTFQTSILPRNTYD